MYVHENDRRECVHAHDDRGHVSVNVHACVLRAHVYVRARDYGHGGDDGHGRDDDQSHQQCHGLFHHVPYAHRSLFPKYCFSRYGLHEDDNRRAKSS